MRTDDFSAASNGVLKRSPRNYHYFLPKLLPPELEFSRLDTIKILSDASQAIGNLAGVGYTVPNPDFLVIPYTRLEAVASSRIEGTQASLSELFFFEADQTEQRPTLDVLEVSNYLAALDYGIERLKTLPISARFIRELHERLMSGARGGTPDKTPGEIRRSQNWIGGSGVSLNHATYVPPHPDELPELLSNWEKFVHQTDSLPPLIRCAVMHYQFEAIHPFLDGNGRVGRLLISLFLIEKGILPQPLLYLSAYFESNRSQYYERLMAVSQYGQWVEWIEFFLNAILVQATHAKESAKRIVDERERYRLVLQENRQTRSMVGIVDILFTHPYFTTKKVSELLTCAHNTAQKSIDYLIELGIVEEITGQKRNRVYVAKQLLHLLAANEPLYRPNEK
ncbi:MAG: Fic family protein [Anaerolineae bacterium]|nr:Fic family protein [Anaerolineae bacterium]